MPSLKHEALLHLSACLSCLQKVDDVPPPCLPEASRGRLGGMPQNGHSKGLSSSQSPSQKETGKKILFEV